MTADDVRTAVTRSTDQTFLEQMPAEARNAFEIAMLDLRVGAVEKWQTTMDARMWILVGSVVFAMATVILHTLHLIP